jgi:hypothetical protein
LEKTVELSQYKQKNDDDELVLLTEYDSGDQLKENGREGHVTCTGEKRNAYRIFLRKPE